MDGPKIESTPADNNETGKDFKKRLCGVLTTLAANETGTPVMRVIAKHPATQWETVWRNIHHIAVPDHIKSTWYAVVQEIIPINEHLADKHLADTDRCNRCGELVSLPHRILECRNGKIIWHWTRLKIAQTHRTAPTYVPAEWTLRPTFQVWPPSRQAAIMWIIAHFVEYKLQLHRCHTLLDYTAYLRRARWKAHRTLPKHTTGKYLEIL
jgi:hypothetical protein